MKFRKPTRDLRVDWDMDYARECVRFVTALPFEFEIVPVGHVCVKWPEELTKERLNQLLNNWSSATTYGAAIRALAEIAPEKKRRKVDIWKHTSGQRIWLYPEDNWHPTNFGWRKVGECEIEEE